MNVIDKAFSGVKWSSISEGSRQLMQLVTTFILARLLSPKDFGLVGMAMVVIGFVSLFKDMGTASAVIQRKVNSESFLSSIFWVNIVFGLVATALLFVLAPFIAEFYHEQKVAPLLRWLSLTFFLTGLTMLQRAILERNLAFDKLAKIEIIATLIGSLVGIGLALMGFGAMSLVFQTLALLAVTAVLLWVSTLWRPKLVCSWTELKSVYSFSLNLTGFQTLYYLMRNMDNLLIGKFLGAQQLGYYTLAYRLMMYPIQTSSAVIGRVILPIYSKIQDDNERFRRVFLRTGNATALITFPMMFGLMALSRPFILAFFGPKWEPAVIVIRILAMVGMLQSLEYTVFAIYQAKARTDWLFRWGLVSGTAIIISFVVGLKWGIAGVAAAYAVTSISLTYPNFAIPFKLIGLPVRDLLKTLTSPFTGSLIMFLALVGLLSVIPQGTSNGLILGLLIPAGIVIYLASVWTTGRKDIRLILEMSGTKILAAEKQVAK
jgi:O-antigen/teichoic acid export membrane protein